MIFLIKGQTLFNNPAVVVYDQTGYYEDGASVVCASAITPEEPVCRYEAKFIAYGDMVYTITNSDELLEEVEKINPDTLLGKTNEDINLDKIVEQIKTIDSQEIVPETPPTTEEVNLNPTSTTTPSTPDLTSPSPEQPIAITPDSMSTTTPSGVDPIIPPVIEPTPQLPNPVQEVIPALDNVIQELNQIADIVENVTGTTTEVPPVTP